MTKRTPISEETRKKMSESIRSACRRPEVKIKKSLAMLGNKNALGGRSKRTHGATGTRIYNIWKNMNKRCKNPKTNNFQYYGGRGIKVCDSWSKFENFLFDMGDAYNRHVAGYGEKSTTLDRIDPNGNYMARNCRWATPVEQRNNRRK